MDLLITMKLSNRSLWNHIFPITSLKIVENIILVRDMPGPDMDKVEYVTPSRYGVSSSILLAPIKLLQLLRASLVVEALTDPFISALSTWLSGIYCR